MTKKICLQITKLMNRSHFFPILANTEESWTLVFSVYCNLKNMFWTKRKIINKLCLLYKKYFILHTLPTLPEPFWAKGRHGKDSPVDEDANLGLVVPGGQGPAVQRIPVGLILDTCIHRKPWKEAIMYIIAFQHAYNRS